MLQGSLFTRNFLEEGITETEAWRTLGGEAAESLRTSLREIFEAFPTTLRPNETQTEDDLIWKVLEALGWTEHLRQQNLSAKGKEDVPDGLLFADAESKARANRKAEEWRRYADGTVIVESKRWLRQLDRMDALEDDRGVPSTQMIRYLRRVDDITRGQVRWGILTNGRHWRLYWKGATSISEEFFELDLAKLLILPGFEPDLLEGGPDHWFRVFVLMFRREAFLPGPDGRTFHQLSLDEGAQWESRVTDRLSDLVFFRAFPDLVGNIVAADPSRPEPPTPAYLDQVREEALVLLYRLLFVLYAEDRNLLPARDKRYDDYGMSIPVRDDIARRIDGNDTFSAKRAIYYLHLLELFDSINEGDGSIGLPPYNGGLFSSARTPILGRVRLPDSVFAPVVDALSRHDEGSRKRRINYRDLSVRHLGTIYEQLLENEVRFEAGAVKVGGDGKARHGSGTYYTPEGPVQLIIHKAVWPLLKERLEVFQDQVSALASDRRTRRDRLDELARLDPATRFLEIKVCDPAMGSGHFLVSLVDYLADRILDAMAEAEALVEWGNYHSPLADIIADTRGHILEQARSGGWPVNEDQLEDRLIVRRMILKRVIHGVDKNPMAVELAKVALWLHTFTVGAPLSFLEHHLRCGDSICGEWIRPVEDELAAGGTMFLRPSVTRAKNTAKKMAEIERLADADIKQVRESSAFFETIEEATRPLARFLDFIHATRWLDRKDRETRQALQAFLDGQFGDPVKITAGEMPPAERESVDTFLALLSEVRALAGRERFLHWEVAFPGVWEDWESAAPRGGFDAVIGNPPYVRQELIKKAKGFLKERYRTFDGVADLYVYFYEQGLRLLKPGGRLSLIVTNKWMKAGYAEKLRALFADAAWMESVVDFGHAKQIFPDADVFPCVLVARKPDPAAAPPATTRVCVIDRDRLRPDAMTEQVEEEEFDLPRERLGREAWNIVSPETLRILDKIEGNGDPLEIFVGGRPLAGIKTPPRYDSWVTA